MSVHTIRHAYEAAISASKKQGCYEKALLISDEKSIREMTKTIPSLCKEVFDLFCFSDLKKDSFLTDFPGIQLESRRFLEDNERVMTSIMSMLASIIEPLFPSHHVKVKDGLDTTFTQIEVPERFLQKNPERMRQNYQRFRYINPTTRYLICSIDWDAIRQAGTYAAQFRSAFEILNEALPPDHIKNLERGRQHTVRTACQVLIKNIRRINDRSNPEPKISLAETPNVALLNKSVLQNSRKFPSNTRDDILQSAFKSCAYENPWIPGIAIHNCLLSPLLMFDFYDKLMEQCSWQEIAYMIFKAIAESPKQHSGLLETFLFGTIYQQVILSDDALNTPFETPLVVRTYEKLYDPQGDKTKRINLRQVLTDKTCGSPSSILAIDKSHSSLYQKLGFSETDAAALCGYQQAMNDTYLHEVILSDLFEQEKTSQHTVPMSEWKELQKQFEALKAKSESLESDYEKKLKKAEQNAHHFEKQLADCEKEKNRLSELVEELNRRLAVCEEEQPGEEPDDTLDDSEDELLTWPSTVGQDLKVTVFGGSSTWIHRMQERFPNIRFVPPDMDPDKTMICTSDLILLNTYVMAHKRFWPIQAIAKKAGKDIMIFPKKGINNCSKYLIAAAGKAGE